MSTRLSIALFLGKDIGEESAKEISTLMTTHWRGIISLPLPISIPWTNWRSGYGKALEAKEKLLKVILENLSDKSASRYVHSLFSTTTTATAPAAANGCSMASEVSGAFTDKQLAAQHLLLFVSALIPKAVASLLTSAVIELAKSENV